MLMSIFSWETIASAIRMTTPLAFASLGGVYSERSGVVNIALEGIMLVGAFSAAVFVYFFNNPWFAIFMAGISGVLFSLIHAIVSINFRVNQIISGVALNMLATGGTTFLSRLIFKAAGSSPHLEGLKPWSIPILSSIPGIGKIFSDLSPLIVIMFLFVILSHFILFKTVFGLRLRSVGENPQAADTLGVNVYLYRYIGVLISGFLGGLGGAFLSLEHARVFVETMTVGRGYIALAAMIFGKWTPFGSLFACFLFGLAEAVRMRIEGVGIPTQFIQMIPYVLTMLVLAGAVGRAIPPAADGIPYEKEEV
ncbi:MAG: branched-chain amino acid ABC transporter permease [Dictyoglomus sp. NZ13-RE01]|nr:MAG: branched-chain amino acid ABC transporter permease [Dictyoglomus sp. NZ13-RE01]